MKKYIGLILCLLLVFLCALALADIEINEANFPDTNFREYISNEIDSDGNGNLSDNEIEVITEININSRKISDLKGIEHFTYLENLSCGENQLTILDVSKNTELNYLNCCCNYLSTLDVSNNTKLIYLYCHSNYLTSLDVSKNSKLTELYCEKNRLTTLDTSQNIALQYLYCVSNKLTSLNINNCINLLSLTCNNNELITLDVSKNAALKSLICQDNLMIMLSLGKNTKLNNLSCWNNKLTALDVSSCTILCQYVKYNERTQFFSYDMWTKSSEGDLYVDHSVTVTAGDTVSEPIKEPKPDPSPEPQPEPEPQSDEQITLKKLKSVKLKAVSKKKIQVSWKKLSSKDRKKIKKIQIQVSTDPEFKTILKEKFVSSKKTSYTVGGLKKNTKYYIRVRAYTEKDGIKNVSEWVKKSKKTKKK